MKRAAFLAIILLIASGCRSTHQISQNPVKMDFERDEVWVLTGMRQKEINYKDEEERITIQFNPETHNFAGYSGCNRYFGDYDYKQESEFEGELRLSRIGSTKMMCPDENMKLEDTFLPLLGKTTHCTITAYKLKLMQGSKILLEFEKL